MRAIIVDDERLARNELRRMLDAAGGVELIGEAKNAGEAIALIDQLRPQLVFLDIQMPDGDGFSVLDQIEASPFVIFTTAFHHHALRAFEVNALDYLVKPITSERLTAALARAATWSRAITAPAGEADRPLGRGQRIFVRDGERCWFVPVEDIALLESEGNYTRLSIGADRPMLARSLNALAARLDPAMFFRANRRQIINLGHVASLAPWPNDGYLVRLTDGQQVEMSRRQARLFQAAARL